MPDTFIEADPEEAYEEAQKSGPEVPESAVGKKLASAGDIQTNAHYNQLILLHLLYGQTKKFETKQSWFLVNGYRSNQLLVKMII